MNRGLTSLLAKRLLRFGRYSVDETSYLGLRPGNLIEFTYGGVRRHGIVVSSRRTSSGIFLSTLDNPLYNVLVCESLDDASFDKLLNTMYGKDNSATYAKVKSMNFGDKFRTLKVTVLRDIYKVIL